MGEMTCFLRFDQGHNFDGNPGYACDDVTEDNDSHVTDTPLTCHIDNLGAMSHVEKRLFVSLVDLLFARVFVENVEERAHCHGGDDEKHYDHRHLPKNNEI